MTHSCSSCLGTSVVDGVSANGFPAPTYTITDGDLPAGLDLDFFTGEITGTPTVARHTASRSPRTMATEPWP